MSIFRHFNNCCIIKQMDTSSATPVFESLASAARLNIFRLLVKAGPPGLVAGEIGTALGIAPTNLSVHLKALSHASLLSVMQEGRYQRYRANLALVQELITFLTAECCAGHPEQCAALCQPVEYQELVSQPPRTTP
jgi:DNA-binding transcriptional ArsR family regulator